METPSLFTWIGFLNPAFELNRGPDVAPAMSGTFFAPRASDKGTKKKKKEGSSWNPHRVQTFLSHSCCCFLDKTQQGDRRKRRQKRCGWVGSTRSLLDTIKNLQHVWWGKWGIPHTCRYTLDGVARFPLTPNGKAKQGKRKKIFFRNHKKKIGTENGLRTGVSGLCGTPCGVVKAASRILLFPPPLLHFPAHLRPCMHATLGLSRDMIASGNAISVRTAHEVLRIGEGDSLSAIPPGFNSPAETAVVGVSIKYHVRDVANVESGDITPYLLNSTPLPSSPTLGMIADAHPLLTHLATLM